MKDLLLARERAFNLVSCEYKMGSRLYTRYSPIYLAATSNVKSTLALYRGYEKVLAVGSTGAHGYEAALNNAKKVDMFDINELQKIYYEYMNTAIMYLDYEDFIKYFTLKEQKNLFKKSDIRDLLSNELFQRLEPYLSKEVQFVLGPIFDYFDSPDIVLSGLVRFEHPITLDYLKKYISFYNREEYYKLQNILRNHLCEINYYQESLENVPNKFHDVYDLIILDNILQGYSNIKSLDTSYKVNMFINKKLDSLLSDNGNLQVAYGFEVATDALKSGLQIPYEESKQPFASVMIKREQKEGICSQLIKKWNNYSYDFILGVEQEMEKRLVDNVVLTYRKRK